MFCYCSPNNLPGMHGVEPFLSLKLLAHILLFCFVWKVCGGLLCFTAD